MVTILNWINRIMLVWSKSTPKDKRDFLNLMVGFLILLCDFIASLLLFGNNPISNPTWAYIYMIVMVINLFAVCCLP